MFFYALNLYNGEFGYNGSVSHVLTGNEMIHNIKLNIVLMDGIPQLLGGFWFLKDLFFALLFMGVITFFIKVNTMRMKLLFLAILFATSIILGYLPMSFYFIPARDLFWSSTFLYSGYLLKDLRLSRNIIIVSAIIFITGVIIPHHLDFFSVKIGMIVFYFTAMTGTILTLKFSHKLEELKAIRGFFYYAGEHTLVILGLHFLSFKLVSLMIIYVEGLTIAHLAEFPVIANHVMYSPIYMLFGVLLPLVVYYFYSSLCCKWIKRE